MIDVTRIGCCGLLVLGVLFLGTPVVQADTAEPPSVAKQNERNMEADEQENVLREAAEGIGVATFVMLVVTICLSVFRKRNPRQMLMLHKISAVVTLLLAATHGTLMIVY